MTGLVAVLPTILALASAGTTLVAVPTAPSSGCPNAAAVAAALRTRLPDVSLPAEPQLWPPGRDVLRSVLEVAPDGTLVRFSLVDAHGDVQLRRSLPTAVHGEADDCVALAEALAAIVERFLDFHDYSPEVGAPTEPTDIARAAPEIPRKAASVGPHGRTWLLYLGGGAQTGNAGNFDGHLGAQIEIARLRFPLGVIASAGIINGDSGNQSTQGHATVTRIPFHLGATAEIEVGPGALEPSVDLGVDQVLMTGTTNPTTTTPGAQRTKDELTNWTLNVAVGYRIALQSHVFLRIRGAAGLGIEPYEVPVQRLGGYGGDLLLSTPRFLFGAGVDAGVVFR